MADDDDVKEYRWETGYEKTWESIKEDEEGLIESVVAEIIQKAKRKRQMIRKGHRRLGMMRHFYLLIDCSESMNFPDLKPTRMLCTVKLLELFIEEFFDQNPICQFGLIVMKNKRAEKLTELSGSISKHVRALKDMSTINLSGEPSLQNGLELARRSLKMIPSHASREIVVIMSSLTTCDPTDILETIGNLKKDGIRCSVVSLSAEIHVCRYLTQQTGGSYCAILDGAHYRDQLFQYVEPPSASQKQENSLIKMGFPYTHTDDGKDPPLTMCMCHIDSTDEPSKLTTGGFNCPQCGCKYCELPVECLSCGLTLVSAPHLARSYHHLFPVNNFTECTFEKQAERCYACQKQFVENNVEDKSIFQCPQCQNYFCIDCDIFVHETLNTCVGCATTPSAMKQ